MNAAYFLPAAGGLMSVLGAGCASGVTHIDQLTQKLNNRDSRLESMAITATG